jgi:hypothetical protein
MGGLVTLNDVIMGQELAVGPPPSRAPADTAWMPLPCSCNDMNAASTPYDLVRTVPE